jgi:leader peptidase (prepilin peptidase)/N-methyltransferase
MAGLMSPLWIPAVAVAGLALGPRQRAAVFRHSVAGDAAARQHCPGCASAVLPGRWRVWPVLPVTGRCPACGERIGPPTLAVELTTAAALSLLVARASFRSGLALGGGLGPDSRAGLGIVLAAATWLAICAVPLAWIDMAVFRLPDRLTVPAYVGTVAALAAAATVGDRPGALLRALAGGAALAAFYLGLFVISPAGMGLGDAKLAAVLGSALAWAGWGTLAVGAMAGFLLAGGYSAALLASHRATRKQHIPFGPFMMAGALIALVAAAA